MGLPELRKGGFMLGQYNPVGQYVFEAWYVIPFLFELRTIIDWTFTQTALDIFQSIKLAQVQSVLFVAKNEMRSYRLHELGAKQPLVKKIAIGSLFLFVVLGCIAGPMLLFSTLNPVTSENPVLGGSLEFNIEVHSINSTNTTIGIFSTGELIQN
jgi:piezo-type mechanosensitive ion channel component 1/2